MEHGSFLSDTLNEYTEWRERCTEIDLLAWWKQAQGPTKVLVLGVFVFRSFGWLVWFPFIYIYNFHIYIYMKVSRGLVRAITTEGLSKDSSEGLLVPLSAAVTKALCFRCP